MAYRAHTTKKLLITFPGRSFPNSHSDAGQVAVDNCRVLWDFHPRGRILSVSNKTYGLFLENCGVEFCSQTMCGNIPYGGGQKFLHQGWDCRERRAGCAMVTALLDLKADGPIPAVENTIAAMNSEAFGNALIKRMESFVRNEMRTLKNYPNNLQQSQMEQNKKLMRIWNAKFQQPFPNGLDEELYLDTETNNYLRFVFNSV